MTNTFITLFTENHLIVFDNPFVTHPVVSGAMERGIIDNVLTFFLFGATLASHLLLDVPGLPEVVISDGEEIIENVVDAVDYAERAGILPRRCANVNSFYLPHVHFIRHLTPIFLGGFVMVIANITRSTPRFLTFLLNRISYLGRSGREFVTVILQTVLGSNDPMAIHRYPDIVDETNEEEMSLFIFNHIITTTHGTLLNNINVFNYGVDSGSLEGGIQEIDTRHYADDIANYIFSINGDSSIVTRITRLYDVNNRLTQALFTHRYDPQDIDRQDLDNILSEAMDCLGALTELSHLIDYTIYGSDSDSGSGNDSGSGS